jgi:uncharacterized protein YegL
MRGEPIEAIKVGLETMVASLRQDPFALESVHLSVVTFSRTPQVLVALTELENLQIPEIQQPQAGGTHLGEALELICKKVDEEVVLSTADRKGDWMPLLFFMGDGRAADIMLFKEVLPKLKSMHFGSIVACSVGNKTDMDNLSKLTDNIVNLETTDSGTFKQFFKWVSASISVGNRSVGATDQISLPPPPPEVHTVI